MGKRLTDARAYLEAVKDPAHPDMVRWREMVTLRRGLTPDERAELDALECRLDGARAEVDPSSWDDFD